MANEIAAKNIGIMKNNRRWRQRRIEKQQSISGADESWRSGGVAGMAA
jgi:hypothetical protein